MAINSPEVQLFYKQSFFIFISKIWEDSSFISEIIYQIFKGFSISVNKDVSIIIFFNFMQPTKHGSKFRIFYRLQHSFLSLHFIFTPDINSDNLAI